VKFERTIIGRVCQVGDGAHASIPRIELGVPYLTAKNFSSDGLDLQSIYYISEKDYQKHFRDESKAITKPKENDLIFSIIGSIGGAYLYNKNDRFGLSSSVAIIRPIENQIYPLFLLYYLKSQYLQKWVDAIKSGSAQGFLSLEMIKKLPINIPSFSEQRKIASILSAYDDLIENNKQRIKLLEEMAQEIYKEWFVRLRFPGYESARFLGEDGIEVQTGTSEALPEGWKKNKITDMFATSSGGTPLRAKDEYYINGNINWIKTKELLDSFIFESEEKISEFGLKNSSAKIFPKDTVLIGMYGGVHGEGRKSTLGQLGILAKPSSTNQACCAFIPKNEHFYSYPYLFLFLKTKRLDYLNMSMGAAQQNISQDIILNSVYINPSNDIIKQFDSMVKPFFEEIKNLSQKNTLLQQTRDLLLPRLISGKLSVEHLAETNCLHNAQIIDPGSNMNELNSHEKEQ
jgi:type I restriction enzyme S subunit